MGDNYSRKKSTCKQLLREVDIYAKPVQLTYKGSEKFKSTFGGVVSLGVVMFFMSVFIYKLNDLFLRNQTQIKKNTLVSISNQYSPPEVISNKNITFAFMVSDFFGEGDYDDPYYGEILLRQNIINIIQKPDGTFSREFIDLDIPYSKCELGRNFFYQNKEEIKNYGIEKFYCPDWKNLTLQGNWYSPQYKVLSLGFRRCRGNNCATEEEFKAWISKITMQEIIISSYFDVKDFENPVHYFLDDLYLPFQYGRAVVSNNYIRRNKLELHDDLFGIFNNQKDQYFYQKSDRVYFTADPEDGPGEGIVFYQSFYLDKNYDVYERRVYSFSGVLQDIGGIYNSLFFAGLFIYEEIKDEKGKEKKKVPKRQKMGTSQSGFKSGIFSKRGSFLGNISILHNMTMNVKDLFFKSIKDKNFSENAYESVVKYLKNRWRIKITFRDIFVFSFWRLFGCCRCRKSDGDSINERKIHLYKKGEQKIKNELDCVNLMTKLRQLDLLLSLQLDKNQKFLLNLQKKHLIQEIDTSTDEDPENIVEFNAQLQKYLDRIKTKKSLSSIDRKILFGLVTKNPEKFVKDIIDKSEMSNNDEESKRQKKQDQQVIDKKQKKKKRKSSTHNIHDDVKTSTHSSGSDNESNTDDVGAKKGIKSYKKSYKKRTNRRIKEIDTSNNAEGISKAFMMQNDLTSKRQLMNYHNQFDDESYSQHYPSQMSYFQPQQQQFGINDQQIHQLENLLNNIKKKPRLLSPIPGVPRPNLMKKVKSYSKNQSAATIRTILSINKKGTL
eukprot:403350812